MEGWIVWTDGWLNGPRCVSGVRVVPGSMSEAKLSFVFLRYKVAARELHYRAATFRVAGRTFGRRGKKREGLKAQQRTR